MTPRERAQHLITTYDQRGVFTPTQQRVLDLLASGRSFAEIGAALGIKPDTASNHLYNAELNARVFAARQGGKSHP